MLYPPDISQESEFSAVPLGWIFESIHPQINKKNCQVFNIAKKTVPSFRTNKAKSLTRAGGKRLLMKIVGPLVGINPRQSGTPVH